MPIAPILMTPYYRFGDQTPWGGDGLRRHCGREIPDDRTGESLEVSAIPGMESRDAQGASLPDLIARYGERLTGKGHASPFPLLLKLLDARDTLSVQVHPDDAYAQKNEHKLGKTEAWHILFARPGARIVYGIRPGATKAELLSAARQGRALEGLLRWVEVKAGETYFIPAGTVHATGEGIVLYEIQQSSDVTYRFYDWDRADRTGRRRELHIQQAVDVVNLDVPGNAQREIPLEKGRFLVLRDRYFCLERFENLDIVLPGKQDRFAFLTAKQDTLLTWEGGRMTLPAWRTALLPADGYAVEMRGASALLAYPNGR